MSQQADDLRRCCDMYAADNKQLRDALQIAHMALIGYLPGHRNDVIDAAIDAAAAAIAGHPEPTSHDCELPDGLIPASPNIEYLRSVTGNSNLPAYMRGQILAAVRRLAQQGEQE